MDDCFSLIEKMNFISMKSKLNEFLNGLNLLQESFYFFFNIMIKVIKTSQDFTLYYINTQSFNSYKDKNQSLEIELLKKNENYMKNAIMALNQKLLDKVSILVTNTKEMEKQLQRLLKLKLPEMNHVSKSGLVQNFARQLDPMLKLNGLQHQRVRVNRESLQFML